MVQRPHHQTRLNRLCAGTEEGRLTRRPAAEKDLALSLKRAEEATEEQDDTQLIDLALVLLHPEAERLPNAAGRCQAPADFT